MVRVKPAGMDTDMGQQRKGAETRLEGIAFLSRCWASCPEISTICKSQKREGKGRGAKLWIDLV